MTKGTEAIPLKADTERTSVSAPGLAQGDEKHLESSNHFPGKRRPSICHPERTRISCFTALTGDHVCGSPKREPHAVDRSRNSRQEIWGSRGICGAPFGLPKFRSLYADSSGRPSHRKTIAALAGRGWWFLWIIRGNRSGTGRRPQTAGAVPAK